MIGNILGIFATIIILWVFYAMVVSVLFGGVLEIKTEKVVQIATLGIVGPRLIASLREEDDNQDNYQP